MVTLMPGRMVMAMMKQPDNAAAQQRGWHSQHQRTKPVTPEEGEGTMKLAIALSAVLSLVGNAYAGCPKEWANPQSNGRGNLLSDFFNDAAASTSPAIREEKKREEAAKATYRALLQAGAPEETASAAALNPDFFRIVAPQYLRPQR